MIRVGPVGNHSHWWIHLRIFCPLAGYMLLIMFSTFSAMPVYIPPPRHSIRYSHHVLSAGNSGLHLGSQTGINHLQVSNGRVVGDPKGLDQHFGVP